MNGRVEKWDHLQNVGNSGTSDGFNHLDLSVFKGGEWAEKSVNYNPQRFFPNVPFTGKTS